MDNWLIHWKKMLPKFLGEEFFLSFEKLTADFYHTKVNIYETSNELLCVFAIPGLKLDDTEIYVYERTLEIRGTIHLAINGFRLLQEEMTKGPFKRTVELPFPVRDDQMDASYHRGILIIHLHRLVHSPFAKKKIEIKNLDES